MVTDGKENQLKGLKGEEFYKNYFIKLGYKDCQIAEKKSLYDSIGIDLINIPYLIQIKTGVQKNMNPGKVLTLMSAQIHTNVPKTHKICTENYNLFVIHHKDNDFNNDIIYMTLDTLELYISKYGHIDYKSINTRNIKSISEFNNIVGINMTEFHNKVLKKEI